MRLRLLLRVDWANDAVTDILINHYGEEKQEGLL